MKNSDWDLDMRAGELGESLIADLLSIDTIEVKTDRRWKETGNLYVETDCYYQATKEWKQSGMWVSKATHWSFVLEGAVVIVPLEELKIAVLEYGKPIMCNIQPNPSRGYLIKPGQILECIRRVKLDEIKAMDEYENKWTDPMEMEELI